MRGPCPPLSVICAKAARKTASADSASGFASLSTDSRSRSSGSSSMNAACPACRAPQFGHVTFVTSSTTDEATPIALRAPYCDAALMSLPLGSNLAIVQRKNRVLEWDDVRLFLALCRSPTVGEAARVLRVDASTVSRRLVALEQALSATLFERGRGGITPTQAAHDLLPVAQDIEEGMRRFESVADNLEHEVSGLVRIACPPDLAEAVLAPLLPQLFARYPKIRIAVQAGEAVVDLARREADIALRTARTERGELVTTKLTTVSWEVVASPALASSLGTLRAWADAPWVGWGERLSRLGPARWLAKHARAVQPVVQSDSLLVQIAAVRSGAGVALIPRQGVGHYGLTPVKLSARLRAEAADLPVDALYLVTHQAIRDVPRIRAVWDLLLAVIGSR